MFYSMLLIVVVFLILLEYVAIAVIFLIIIASKSVNYNWCAFYHKKRIFLRWNFLDTHWTTKASFIMKCISLFKIYGQGTREATKDHSINIVSLILPTIFLLIFFNQSIFLHNAPSSSKIDFWNVLLLQRYYSGIRIETSKGQNFESLVCSVCFHVQDKGGLYIIGSVVVMWLWMAPKGVA